MASHFMSAKEAAEYLNMSIQWIYREAPEAGLAPYRFGRGKNAKLQFKVTELNSWIKQQKISTR
ncbi:helix-turn-helix domain-containing protein [Streptomyces sp. NPDC059913]|uniref:helix-turn-helix domain-containing protein n=1 Tax=unclassified Streptomyces TaxID=2593676 RepID=UPI003667F7EB